VNRVVFRHFAERTMVTDDGERQRLAERQASPEEILADLRHTGAEHYLNLA
jgi:hypothetical protein